MNNIASCFGWFVFLLLLGWVVPVQASPQEAVEKYKKGRALIEKQEFEEALRELTASQALLDSPNTLLLMAHAHRELGREAKAAELYEAVIQSAQLRVAAGESRFARTQNEAESWLTTLSTTLGKITIRVEEAPEGTTLWVEGEEVEGRRDSETSIVVDSHWAKAGRVLVEARTKEGRTQTLRIEVSPGKTAEAKLIFKDEESTEPVVVTQSDVDLKDVSKKSIPMGSWITGGVGLAGVATFAVFGSMAKSKANELDECSPHCPESLRSTADEGKRNQTIANIGLVVGGLGLASAIGLYFLQSSDSQERSVDVAVAPNGLLLRGSFH
jgi:hypothetical protein